MGALRLALSALALAAASPAAAGDPVDRWAPHVAEAAARFGIPEAWIRRVMREESGGRTELNGRPIESRAGAIGLMQLMPRTWQEMREAQGLGPDPNDPRDNILAGAAYLRAMYDRFGYPGLFAAYNAGPARYRDHLLSGRPLPGETTAYVEALAGAEAGARGAGDKQQAWPTLFAMRAEPPRGEARETVGSPASAAGPLFVPLGATAR